MTISRDIDDQGILHSDWLSVTTGHTQPKVIAPQMLPFFDDYLLAKNLRY